MTDPTLLVLAFAATLALALVSAAALRGWQGWLELRRLELNGGRAAPGARGPARVELTELRDRVRRLEALANGVEG
ncbi:MAG: hypothetical protein ACT4N8_06815 [Sphingosinicella sp.]|uniref:hypothetical protein n=1 Tax=Sphingosinicella sp. TaxID=1917971 RepID=UPI0040383709